MQLIAQATLMMFLLWQGKISLKSTFFQTYGQTIKFVSLPYFRADVVDYGNAFNLTKYLINETDYIVWERVASSIAYVRDMLSGNAALYSKFQVSCLLVLSCLAIKFQNYNYYIRIATHAYKSIQNNFPASIVRILLMTYSSQQFQR